MVFQHVVEHSYIYDSSIMTYNLTIGLNMTLLRPSFLAT